MTLDAEIGDIKYYHEMGDVFRVEVLDAQEKINGKLEGEEYRLRILGIARINPLIKKEAHMKVDGVFSVWKHKNAGAYAGWYLLDTA